MHLKILKPIRVGFSLVFFFLLLFVFIDCWAIFSASVIQSILFFQFIPSLIKFIGLFTITSSGFIVIISLTLLFGRIYCSSFCPLGTLNDLIIGIYGRITKKKFKYQNPRRILACCILTGIIVTFLAHVHFLINVLDPFGLSGKIFSELIRPLPILLNNTFSRILQLFNDFSIRSIPIKQTSIASLIFSSIIFIIIFILALLKNRLYCNSVCPIGTFLGLVSKGSLFKILINHNKCNNCGLCIDVCKAGCIDLQTQQLEFDRCIACYNCIYVCKEKAIDYKFLRPNYLYSTKKRTKLSRRLFIQRSIAGIAGIAGFLAIAKILQEQKWNKIYNPVTPPGSNGYLNFSAKCISCHLCISACPTHVLQPSFFEYGLNGIFQPKMDFWSGYCKFDCVICSETCPSGAVLPVNKEEKHRIQIGISTFIRNICIVVNQRVVCGLCSEHCPTKAIEMVPYLGTLKIPKINQKTCIGCGACEFACPTKPEKAIFVEANMYHSKARIPA